MDKIITVLGYKKFITEMSDAPDWSCLISFVWAWSSSEEQEASMKF